MSNDKIIEEEAHKHAKKELISEDNYVQSKHDFIAGAKFGLSLKEETCPLCGEKNFHKEGLRNHLLKYCVGHPSNLTANP